MNTETTGAMGRAGRGNSVEVVGGKDPATGESKRGRAQDADNIQKVGSQPIVIFVPSISDQAVLDRIAATILASFSMAVPPALAALGLTAEIQLGVIDKNPVGSFKPEDQITATSPILGLSGAYYVKRIQRDLMSPRWATVDLVTRTTELWMLDEHIRAAVKDLAAQVTT
jgi:hypothetical protein